MIKLSLEYDSVLDVLVVGLCPLVYATTRLSAMTLLLLCLRSNPGILCCSGICENSACVHSVFPRSLEFPAFLAFMG